MTHDQPHDRLLKETLSHIEEAILFFKKFLPAHISRHLDYSYLRMEDKTFLNEGGREFYADLVFSCRWQDSGKQLFLHLLVEHKSVPEKRPLLQIGGYLSEGYLAQVKLQREAKRLEKLTPIVPLLLYHGNETWELESYQDYFDLPDPALACYLPSFELIMIDLSNFSDDEIIELGLCFLASTLLAFKHKHDKDYVVANTKKVFIFVGAKGNPETIARFFRVFILYLFKAFQFKKDEIEKMVEELPKISKAMFESTYDMIVREGEIKGEAIGIQKGEAIGAQKRALTTALQGIIWMPEFGNAQIARLSDLPESFIAALRECYLTDNLSRAQQIAVGVFSDLQGFSNEEAEQVKEIVKKAWRQEAGK